MALSRVKVWSAGEILYALDLNSEFNNLLNNSLSLISPLTTSLNAGGFKISNYGGTDAPTSITDAALNAFVQSGTGAVTRTLQSKLRESVSVLDFIPTNLHASIIDGSNTTDLFTYILAAVNAAVGATSSYTTTSGVYFPPGVYLVSTTAALTSTASTTARGIRFHGDGMYASIIRFGTLGGSTWMYDNGATARRIFDVYENLGFEGTNPASVAAYTDIPTNANGFKITSSTWEQGFRFVNCRFGYFNVLFDEEGTNLASEMKFFGCKIHDIRSTVDNINNLQSYNHEFFGCDVETIFGDVFTVGTSGGGCIKVFGGSWIMKSDTGSDTYFFKATGSTGAQAQPFVFDGIRFELNGDKTKLVNIATLVQFSIDFRDCNIVDAASVTKSSWVTIGTLSTVHFTRCNFYQSVGANIRFVVAGSTGDYGLQGEIIFYKCQLDIDWSDYCSVTTASGGSRISAIDCFGTDTGVASPTFLHHAHDFDLHWSEANPGQVATWAGSGATLTDAECWSHPQWRLKVAVIKLTTQFWPSTGGEQLKLPKNAIIKGIHIRKPSGSADATVVTYNVNRKDKSGTAHLTTNSAAFNLTHSGDLNDYYYHVGTTTNERTLLLYPSAGITGALQGGMAIVEYY